VFAFGEWVGGRYSVWSSVGLPIAIAVGMPAFERFLAGAHAVDLAFRSAPLERNVPFLLAATGVWNRNFLGIPGTWCCPLRPAHGDCPATCAADGVERQRVDAGGNPPGRPAAIFGEAGTLGQHAFYQWLHQGTDPASCDFVVVARPMGARVEEHRELLAHALAQSEALMTGRDTGNPHRDCPGNRPSTTFVLPALEPAALGALVAIYEHKVYAQAVLWGVNPFDQFGVELGKTIAANILPASGRSPPLHPPPITFSASSPGRWRPACWSGARRHVHRDLADRRRCAPPWRSPTAGVVALPTRLCSPATGSRHSGHALPPSSTRTMQRVRQNVARIAEGKTASALIDASA
jgi:glucose-6-phosphate isomerase